eukprot:c1889_g1_i1 orf=114-269(+)
MDATSLRCHKPATRQLCQYRTQWQMFLNSVLYLISKESMANVLTPSLPEVA